MFLIYLLWSKKNNKPSVLAAKTISFFEKFRILDNPVSRIAIFVLVSILLISTNTSSLSSKNIKSAVTDIKSLRYGKNETELKCLIFIGDTASFSHYWSITDKSVISINTSSIQIIETMFEAEEKAYLTFTPENPKPEHKGSTIEPPPRYPLTSPFYDKWRNEVEERTNSINNSCKHLIKAQTNK